ncbi:MAG TPA: hypothetical protein VL282_19440 [Tepidisphaeraceae bacterium]|nr:hypothetical protein [Tepidisphaeraceae bacterium]
MNELALFARRIDAYPTTWIATGFCPDADAHAQAELSGDEVADAAAEGEVGRRIEL